MKGMVIIMPQIYKPEGSYEALAQSAKIFENMHTIEEAMEKGTILEAPATLCDSERNLCVQLGKYKGIIEKDEAVYCFDQSEPKDIAVITRVGKSVCFKIIGAQSTNGQIKYILSRKAAQKECFDNFVSNLLSGDIIDAKITHCEPFGCFCDIGCGIISLLSIDCISVSRISHPKERFYIGQSIKAAVKSTCDMFGRITLTHKELLGTWEQNASLFDVGQTVAGIIRSVEPYGIFVELTPNLAGLAEWRNDVKKDNIAAVYIKSIIPEKMKIKLVIVDPQSTALPSFAPFYAKEQGCFEYFVKDNHIDFWKYSPLCAAKQIETVFE